MNHGSLTMDALTGAAEACRRSLEAPSFAAVLDCLGPLGTPERAFALLAGIPAQPEADAELARLCAEIPSPSEENLVERALLILASQHAIPQVPGLPVSERVKGLFADEFQFFASPPESWVGRFGAADVRYREMVRVATLRRFPAGQFHWEVSAFPRSWVARTARPWGTLAHVLGRMHGFGPVFELHVNERRKNRLILLEKEANLSYYRAARSLEKQRAVRGLMLASWLFCKQTAEVTPHLAWLRRTPQAAGALLVDLGPAAADSGFLTGSEERRKLYEQGAYRPTFTCVLWPRRALIEWANRHPEFDA